MDILVILLFLGLIFLLTGLKTAQKQINQLKKQQFNLLERLAFLERQQQAILNCGHEVTPEKTTKDSKAEANAHSTAVKEVKKATPASQSQPAISNLQTAAVPQTKANQKVQLTRAVKTKETANPAQKQLQPALLSKKTAAQTVVKQPQPKPVNIPAAKQPAATQPAVTQLTITPPARSAAEGLSKQSPSVIEQGIAHAKAWLTTGNIPVKIGMLVLFSAVIAFLRYAASLGWFSFPMPYRLIAVAVSALAALGFAWKKRHTKRSFSLSVQGGCIGILLLVIFSAVRMYGFISPGMGFIFSITAVLLAAILALAQDAKGLIIMAIFAGFLAPIWLSNGLGTHVVLFSYYAILNLGIFVVAWLKPWRELNRLGFVFTYIIGSTWGGLAYSEQHFASTEPFVILFFLFYLALPLRYAQRASKGDKRYANQIDSALLFGTPLVTFGLEVGMLYQQTDWLALICVAMGLVYTLLALCLRGRQAYRTLYLAYTGLAAGFLTLAIPIGLSAKATATLFAIEGAAGVWFACRERRLLTWVSGVFLQMASAIAFFTAYMGVPHSDSVFINERYISSLLIVISAGICLFACHHYAKCGLKDSKQTNWPTLNALLREKYLAMSAKIFFLWAMLWWLMPTIDELAHQKFTNHDNFLLCLFTAAGLIILSRYYREKMVAIAQVLLLLPGVIVAIDKLQQIVVIESGTYIRFFHKFVSFWDFAIWGLYALVGWLVWRNTKTVSHRMIDNVVVMWLLSITAMISALAYPYLPIEHFHSGWYWWIILAPWLLLSAVISLVPQWLNQMAPRVETAWQTRLAQLVFSLLALAFLWVIHLSGGENAWWLPIVNTVDSLALVIASLGLFWLLNHYYNSVKGLGYFIAATFIFTVTLRMMHHWGGFSVWRPLIDFTWPWHDKNWFVVFGFWLLVAWSIPLCCQKLSDRLQEAWQMVIDSFIHCIIALLFVGWGLFVFRRGEAFILPWLPLLNFADFLQITIVIFLLVWVRNQEKIFCQNYMVLLAYVLIVPTLVVITLRMVHHWGGYSVWTHHKVANWNDWLELAAFGFWLLLLLGLRFVLKNFSHSTFIKHWSVVLQVIQTSLTAMLFAVWFLLLFDGGNATPLPWLVLINPLAVLQWSILVLMGLWLKEQQDKLTQPFLQCDRFLPALALCLITVMTLRLVHHYAAIAWSPLMFKSAITQMALTLVWSVLGVISWIVGSRRASRSVWVLGAFLMGVVLLKLVVIDRGHLGNLFGIASFFAYGLLCVVVGYFAPMPPSEERLATEK